MALRKANEVQTHPKNNNHIKSVKETSNLENGVFKLTRKILNTIHPENNSYKDSTGVSMDWDNFALDTENKNDSQ